MGKFTMDLLGNSWSFEPNITQEMMVSGWNVQTEFGHGNITIDFMVNSWNLQATYNF